MGKGFIEYVVILMNDFTVKNKYLGETVDVDITILDAEGTATDASAVTYSVKDPSRTVLVDDSAATHGVTGNYSVSYTLPLETTGKIGTYTLSIKVTMASGEIDVQKTTFNVEASI